MKKLFKIKTKDNYFDYLDLSKSDMTIIDDAIANVIRTGKRATIKNVLEELENNMHGFVGANKSKIIGYLRENGIRDSKMKTRDDSYRVSYKNNSNGTINQKAGFKSPQDADAWVNSQGKNITAYKLLIYNPDIQASDTVKVYNKYVKDTNISDREVIGGEYINKTQLTYNDLLKVFKKYVKTPIDRTVEMGTGYNPQLVVFTSNGERYAVHTEMGKTKVFKDNKINDTAVVVNNMNDLKRLFSNFPKGDVDINYGRSGFYYHIRPKADGKVSIGSSGYDGTFNTLREALEWVAYNFGDLVLNVNPDGSNKDSRIKDADDFISKFLHNTYPTVGEFIDAVGRRYSNYKYHNTSDGGVEVLVDGKRYKVNFKLTNSSRPGEKWEINSITEVNRDSVPEKPDIPAKGEWEWDDVEYDWWDTGRCDYYERIMRNHTAINRWDNAIKDETVNEILDRIKDLNTGEEIVVDGYMIYNDGRGGVLWGHTNADMKRTKDYEALARQLIDLRNKRKDRCYKVTHKDKTYKIKASSRKDAAIKLINILRNK